MPGYIYEGTAENFAELVLANSRKGPVVVDFWAPWAGPSQRQREVLTRLVDRHGGRFLLVTVNTDRQKPLAREYGVSSLPSLRVFRHGRIVDAFHGMQTQADYEALIDRHLGLGGSAAQGAALDAWRRGDTDGALQVLAEAAVADPDDLSLPATMAKLLLRLGRAEEAAQLLDVLPADARDTEEIAVLSAHVEFLRAAVGAAETAMLDAAIAADPDDSGARWERAALHLLADEYEPALQQLMEILRRDRNYRDDLARRGLLALFDIVEGQEALIKKYRAELFRLIH
jgi:putative thioredoxin